MQRLVSIIIEKLGEIDQIEVPSLGAACAYSGSVAFTMLRAEVEKRLGFITYQHHVNFGIYFYCLHQLCHLSICYYGLRYLHISES